MTNLTSKKSIHINDFDYHLPDHLIARYPLDVRSDSRLLHIKGGQIFDRHFCELPDLLNTGDLIVFNDTKVMKARLFGQKQTGGKIEILVERIIADNSDYHAILNNDYPFLALCHIKASKAPKTGNILHINNSPTSLCVLGRLDNLFIVGFNSPILQVLEKFGELPIPPYFERLADDKDDTRYQTVFHNPKKLASVASPTASLHFDDNILNALKNKGINTAFVTLNVGAGTFAPVKTDNILAHKMHKEYAELPQATADLINQTKQNGKQVIAVGTTVTRVLETAYLSVKSGKQPTLSAWAGDTDIFIYPPFEFGVVDRLVTNFHLPKSTLLMLVSAFVGTDVIKEAYAHAIKSEYRFFSYGDAMILDR
ncbi:MULTISPECIES: tRNA preQ1(34) S-adenosylmethionine ribosyltransferase-isomerase QueA [unclassified Moraxella]|uniref:tRNA preQ1(34) S-adenosylmethionine ribosyltransferase-isomerase QueA n=1 Tax=unclassified Moraxella TaxID=2685852 RepID=UPI002B404ACA|nr:MULTISPECIES: tRNA preQ1(34) S-adenosylmethionine ribosyltransferase-isomerase QueA [unclassified Moraxella]